MNEDKRQHADKVLGEKYDSPQATHHDNQQDTSFDDSSARGRKSEALSSPSLYVADKDCIFCEIIDGDIPSYKIYEDEKTLAFLDANPVNPGHTLVVPKEHHRNILDMPEDVMAPLTLAVKKVANAVKDATDAGGISVQMNNEPPAGQVIFHAHFHVIPRHEGDGLRLWPQDEYKEGEAEEIAKEIRRQL